MCPNATEWVKESRVLADLQRLTRLLSLSALVLMLVSSALSQPLRTPDWRRVGNTVVDVGLASPAGGPVERVWYSDSGDVLYAQTEDGRVFETSDFESWSASSGTPTTPPTPLEVAAERKPESTAVVYRAIAPGSSVWYGIGQFVYSSNDQGRTWNNRTRLDGSSIIGGGLTDIALSPRDGDEITVAGRFGVWRTLDAGLSWCGLNETLPNLPGQRIAEVPSGATPARLLLDDGGDPMEVEWDLTTRSAWVPEPFESSLPEAALRGRVGGTLGVAITAVAESPDHRYVYAGSADGRLWGSSNGGQTFQLYPLPTAGAALSIHVVKFAPDLALATVAPMEPAGEGPRVFRTMNAGVFWDDITGALPASVVHGVAADLASNAIYVATDVGLFLTYADLRLAPPPTPWMRVPGLPSVPVLDVRLDADGNQIYALAQGDGLYRAMAPHRFRDPRLVNAADLSDRAVAPGTLLSVLGARVAAARAGNLEVPILAASDGHSEIQVPFEADGSSLTLALLTGAADESLARRSFDIPLRAAAPAIFVDRDGLPMILDADKGILLDASTPVRPGMRIQILATGLGRVQPSWPDGQAAPAENPPRVVAPVHVFLNGLPLEVTRATLAPLYVGFYVVEVEMPEMLTAGVGELYLEVSGEASDKVSVFTLP